MESKYGLMRAGMKVTGNKIKLMDMESYFTQMVISMKGTG